MWQGVYTEARRRAAQSEYTTHCASCHRDDLGGYNDILKGQRFMEKNRESSLHLFFDKTRTTMPRGAPASLSDKAYVDIVSYMLKVNEFPAGAQELRVEDLAEHSASSERMARSGCRTSRSCGSSDVSTTNPSDGAWMLTHSTDPVRTGNPQPADGRARSG